MPLVIPKWKGHAVADWNSLLVVRDNGRLELNEATVALLNYMPVIGITCLTKENVDDAWCRIAIHQGLFGSFVLSNVKDETSQQLFLTKSDVVRHIGIETEGTEKSLPEFWSYIHKLVQSQEEGESPFFKSNGKRSLLQVFGVSGR